MMSEKKVFFQDFIFENLPVDESDNPAVDVLFISDSEIPEAMMVSFDKLLRMNKKEEWDDLNNSVLGRIIVIFDDVSLSNEELVIYKDFYLKAYFYHLSQYASKCYVLK